MKKLTKYIIIFIAVFFLYFSWAGAEINNVAGEKNRTKVEETRKIRIGAFYGKIMNRMEVVVIRLQRLSERIDSRINKLEETGADVSEAKALLEAADGKIKEAVKSLSDAKNKINEILDSGETPKIMLEKIKDEVRVVKQAIKDAHAALVDVIAAIKPGLL